MFVTMLVCVGRNVWTERSKWGYNEGMILECPAIVAHLRQQCVYVYVCGDTTVGLLPCVHCCSSCRALDWRTVGFGWWPAETGG